MRAYLSGRHKTQQSLIAHIMGKVKKTPLCTHCEEARGVIILDG